MVDDSQTAQKGFWYTLLLMPSLPASHFWAICLDEYSEQNKQNPIRNEAKVDRKIVENTIHVILSFVEFSLLHFELENQI